MATEEHLVLSSLIKSVHQDLRSRTRDLGFKVAWIEHCNKKNTLNEYATAMYRLATEYWENNTGGDINNRIEWIVTQCQSYFFDGGLEKINTKEKLKISRMESFRRKSGDYLNSVEFSQVDFIKPLLMLDVGSCYNPFKQYPLFTTVPIDLAPATTDVFPCDFLEVKVNKYESSYRCYARTITELLSFRNSDSGVKQLQPVHDLPAELFDVVNFSLFLEYLPSADLRYACCQKVFDLLRTGGLLFIITPDSKHASANAPIMRNWRIALETIGFVRVAYQKLTHLHCMAFRKCPYPFLPKALAERDMSHSEKYAKLLPSDMMMIPQDLSVNSEEFEKTQVVAQESLNTDDVNFFSELPLSF